MVKRGCVLGTILLVASIGCAASPLTILYTNDLHLRFERLASIEELILRERAGSIPVLLFDGGDAWQDFRRPQAAVWGANELVEWMNHVGYDAMALGNHDMYWGEKRLGELAQQAEFPVLCANLVSSRHDPVPFVPSARLGTDEIPVLAIGLITEEFLPYSAYPALRLTSMVAAVRDEICRAAGDRDVIAVVAHLPIADAVRISAEVPRIDIFITGHSHEETQTPVCVGKTLIVQSGAFGKKLGRLMIDVNSQTGAVQLINHELIPTAKTPAKIGRGLHQLLRVMLGIAFATLLVVR